MPKQRVALKFSVVTYEPITHQTPQGPLTQPKHWRLLDSDGRILGSGPWESETAIVSIMRMAGEFIKEHPDAAQEITRVAAEEHKLADDPEERSLARLHELEQYPLCLVCHKHHMPGFGDH